MDKKNKIRIRQFNERANVLIGQESGYMLSMIRVKERLKEIRVLIVIMTSIGLVFLTCNAWTGNAQPADPFPRTPRETTHGLSFPTVFTILGLGATLILANSIRKKPGTEGIDTIDTIRNDQA